MPPRQPPRGRTPAAPRKPLPKKRVPAKPVEKEAPKEWGSLARKGVGRMRDDRPYKAADAFEAAAPPERRTDKWVRTDVRDEAEGAVSRGSARPPRDRTKRPAPDVAAELNKAVGPSSAPKLGQRLAEATKAYERERYTEARKLLKPLSERAPGSAAVRELYGLTLYRLGHWKLAVSELEAFRTLSRSSEQHPVLADCYRALKRYREVNELWEELRIASPSAELVAEGRIVAAGAMADRGDLNGAIRLLEAGIKPAKRLKPHHVRMLYVLADVVERAGDIPRARQLFNRVADADPDFADVRTRIRALR
jgi:tetratricopeptide (TPR) repeat protein